MRSLCGHCTVTVRSLYGHCYFLAFCKRWRLLHNHVPAEVPPRHFASVAAATLLEMPALRLVQTLAPARHVREAVLHEARRQANRSAAQTPEVFISGLLARAFPPAKGRVRVSTGKPGRPPLRRQLLQNTIHRDGRWTKSCTTSSRSRGPPRSPRPLILKSDDTIWRMVFIDRNPAPPTWRMPMQY